MARLLVLPIRCPLRSWANGVGLDYTFNGHLVFLWVVVHVVSARFSSTGRQKQAGIVVGLLRILRCGQRRWICVCRMTKRAIFLFVVVNVRARDSGGGFASVA